MDSAVFFTTMAVPFATAVVQDTCIVLLACMLGAGKAVSDPCVTLQQLLFAFRSPMRQTRSVGVPA